MSAFVVVNPRSGNGRTGREWKAIEPALADAFPRMSVAFTHARRDATMLVRNALREGHHEIIAVGGDGTINEAVNGFFDASGAISPGRRVRLCHQRHGRRFPQELRHRGRCRCGHRASEDRARPRHRYRAPVLPHAAAASR